MSNPHRTRTLTVGTIAVVATAVLALTTATSGGATAPPEVGTPLDPPVSPVALEFIDADECHVFELDESQQPYWFECTRADEAGDVGIIYITPVNDPVAAWEWATARPDFNEFVASLFYIQGGGFLYQHSGYWEMFDVAPWPDLHIVDTDCAPFPETYPGEGLCPDTPPTFPEEPVGDEPVAATDGGGFVMPDVVGMNLQEAQDLIQSTSGNPFFYTSSVDATGDDRMQLIDSNWYVCAQNVAAGTTVDDDTDITFTVVKTEESCPLA